MKRNNIYNIVAGLGLSKKDVDDVLSSQAKNKTVSADSPDLYKAGTDYGTVSPKDVYKAGTRYGTVNSKDIYKAGTIYGTVASKDIYKAGTIYGTVSIKDF
jgi:hypothetical protein